MAAQATKTAGCTGNNVDVALYLPTVLRKLARATRFDGSLDPIIGDRGVNGGEASRPYTPLDAGRFAVDYLWRELLSKYDDGTTSSKKLGAALDRFAAAEVQCGNANLRLSRLVGLPDHLAVSDIEHTLCVARRKIRGILGRFDWSHAARGFGFSGGASFDLPRTRGAVPHKYSGTPETTYANAALAAAAIYSCPLWRRGLVKGEGPVHISIVPGNRVTTVAKNYKTDRVIACEPRMNMYIQRGIGGLIRERLKRIGIDLNTQERNQGAAFMGSLTGFLATIDLSMASDTVALELVRFLLPSEWLNALEQCRSPQGVLPSGEVVTYRKFSSMGNGYTFELETLIFYALTAAVCELLGLDERQVLVYGDDIVVPVAAGPRLTEVFSFCGFSLNENKSFVSGPFRESCGKHYFNGIDVSPFYLRSDVKTLTDLFKFHNQLYRWWSKNTDNLAVDHRLMRKLVKWLRSVAPSEWRRPRIPDGFGDGAFIGTFDECLPKLSRDGWEGYTVEVLGETAVKVDLYEEGWGVKVLRKKTSADRSRDRSEQAERWRPKACTRFLAKPKVPQPDEFGRLLQSLVGCGASERTVFSTPFEGGIELPPRTRLMKITVDGFALDPALNCF